MKAITVKPQMIKGEVYLNEKSAYLGCFFIVCGAIGNDIKCVCDGFDYREKYKNFLKIVEQFGCKIEYFADGFKVKESACMSGQTVEYRDVRENITAFSVLCAFCKGESRVKGVPFSDREIIKGIVSEFSHLGVKAEITGDGMIISGTQILRCDGAYAWENPYLAMALIIAGARCEGELLIMGTDEFESNEFDEFMKIYNELVKEKK